MAEIAHLPERPPEGWEPSSMFEGAWIRKVSTRPGLKAEDAVYEIHGPDAIVLLMVERDDDGFKASANHVPAGTHPAIYPACMAAERVYCGAVVRRG